MLEKINNIELIRLKKEGKSIRYIATLYSCNTETIRLRLKKLNIDTSKEHCKIKCVHCNGVTRKEGTNNGKQRYFCLICNKIFVNDIKNQINERNKRHDLIKKLYLVDNLSTVEIGKILGVSSTVPQRILKKYNLTRKLDIAIDTKLANKLNLTYDEYILTLPAFKKYKKDVWYYTRKQDIKNLPNYEFRGLSGINGAYQLDHKFSILEGFKCGISPEILGNINNLEFLPWEDNRAKATNSSITLEELNKVFFLV